MKSIVSQAALVLLVSTFQVHGFSSYLNNLAPPSPPVQSVTEEKVPERASPSNYLEGIGSSSSSSPTSGSGPSSYDLDVASFEAELHNAYPLHEPAFVPARTLDASSTSSQAESNAPNPTSQGLSSHLDSLGSRTTALSGGVGINSHASTLLTDSALSGTGLSGYLDTITEDASSNAVHRSTPPEAESHSSLSQAANHVDKLSSSSSNLSGPGLIGHLDALGSGGTALSGGGGINSHTSSLASGSSLSGAGLSGYLDGIAPSSGSAAATYAPSTPEATSQQPNSQVANHVDSLSSIASDLSGQGFTSHLDSLGSVGTALSGGRGINSHTSSLESGSALSGAGVGGYLDAIAPPGKPYLDALNSESQGASQSSEGSGMKSYLDGL